MRWYFQKRNRFGLLPSSCPLVFIHYLKTRFCINDNPDKVRPGPTQASISKNATPCATYVARSHSDNNSSLWVKNGPRKCNQNACALAANDFWVATLDETKYFLVLPLRLTAKEVFPWRHGGQHSSRRSKRGAAQLQNMRLVRTYVVEGKQRKKRPLTDRIAIRGWRNWLRFKHSLLLAGWRRRC